MKFKIIRSDRAFAQTAKALEAGLCTLLLEKGSMGDRLFVLNLGGESIGVLDFSTRSPGCPYARAVHKFMEDHERGDGLLPGLAQTYGLLTKRLAAMPEDEPSRENDANANAATGRT